MNIYKKKNMDIIEVMKKVKKEIGISPDIEIIDSGMGRYSCSDNYTTILASKDDQDIRFWAVTHKQLVSMRYRLIKSGKEDETVAKDDYTKIIIDKLKQCHREPEIDIILSKKYGDVAIVAYTDTIDSIVQENKTINAIHSV